MPAPRFFTSALNTFLPRASRRFLRMPAPCPATTAVCEIDILARRIILPSMPITDEEMARAEFQDRGQKLARQEMWEELAQEVRTADSQRNATPGGESAAMLLAFGARSDVVAVAEDALHEGVVPARDGIFALEQMLEEYADDYACGLIVAMTHVDMGWAWRHAPDAPSLGTSVDRLKTFHAHFAKAAKILSDFCGLALDAPSLAAAQCALLAAQSPADRRVAEDYEDLIDLDPHSPRHMRALGQNLLPGSYGTYDQLELQARRTASRTGHIWGAGAYTWVYFDALAVDPDALSGLDVAFFTDGMRDILARKPDQHYANLLAAFCAVTMASDKTSSHKAARRALHQSLSWILSDHLHELHPLIWTQALHRPGLTPPLPSRRALITEGRRTALRAIAAIFADDIAEGNSIAFSPAGMYRLPTTIGNAS